MYMIQATNTGSAPATDVGGVEIPAGGKRLFPADQCVFNTSWSESKQAYEVSDAVHFVGAIVTASTANEMISQANIEVLLGYISKTGRFVAMTK